MAIDRAMLDEAVADLGTAGFIERLGEFGTKRDFSLSMVMDTRSGRLSKATIRAGEELEPGLNEVIITVHGTLTQEANDKGQITTETMTFDRTDVPPHAPLSDIARVHLQKLLEAWRETHNR